jgi:alkylhydroperoxidase/carboxymuconolactone decarboxylase family protein YurZ
MAEQTQEAERQHMLLMVESALRAGRSEEEIAELVDEAAAVDAGLERAA